MSRPLPYRRLLTCTESNRISLVKRGVNTDVYQTTNEARRRRLAETITPMFTACSFEVQNVILCVQLRLDHSSGLGIPLPVACETSSRARTDKRGGRSRSWVRCSRVQANELTTLSGGPAQACGDLNVQLMSGSRTGKHIRKWRGCSISSLLRRLLSTQPARSSPLSSLSSCGLAHVL